MTEIHTPTRKHLQQHLDELVGDQVLFTLHDGHPGPYGIDNLAFGTGLPQRHSFTEGGSVGFRIPSMPVKRVRVPLPRKWWQIRSRYRIEERRPMLVVQAVMLWSRSNRQPIVTVDLPEPEYWLTSGEVFIIYPTRPRFN
ncbi:hypothetical protein [Nocardia sp. NPDC051833]|uniref:hypothetical protein n=1 Tax=Nocardia sp. NPDC051833 TaxID=3155674 RepID=UPI00341CD4D6